MKNLDKHEWDFTIDETYAIKWFESHGYEVTINKRTIQKDCVTISKDGYDYSFELPLGNMNRKNPKYMKQIEMGFVLSKKLAEKKI